MPTHPRLALLTPLIDDPLPFAPRLAAACAAGPVAAVLLRLASSDERTLVNRVKALAPVAQRQGAAVIVADPGEGTDLAAIVTRGGADGAHAVGAGRLRALRDRLGQDRSVGAGGLRSRHDAMEAGESGVDYVLFGEPRQDGSLPPLEGVAERAAWWAEIFQVPCIAFASDLAAVRPLAGTGAEFVALGDAAWTHPDGPEAAVAAAVAALAAPLRPETVA